MPLTDFRTLSKPERKRLLRRNRGLLSRAAELAGVTRGQASRVFWGYTKVSESVAQAINALLNDSGTKE